MEAHPIPQNVTSFEFHLIGDMTVKQFAFLATGSVIAFFIYLVFSSLIPYVAWPLIGFFVLTGVAFAFLPISERPLDHWLLAYFKAITTPTQAVWKNNSSQVNSELFTDRLRIYFGLEPMPAPPLKTTSPSPVAKPDSIVKLPNKSPLITKPPKKKLKRKHSSSILSRASVVLPQVRTSHSPIKPSEHKKNSLFIEPNRQTKSTSQVTISQPVEPPPILQATPGQFFPPAPIPAISLPPENPLPTSEELKETVELARKAHDIQQQILETEHRMNQIKATAAIPGSDPTDFTEVFEEVVTKLQSLTKEESEISHEMALISENHDKEQAEAEKKAQIKLAPPTPTISVAPTPPPIPQPESPKTMEPSHPDPTAPTKEVSQPASTGIPSILAEPNAGLHPLPRIAIVPIAKEAKPVTIAVNLTTIPNIINGIVTDAQNNYLEGVIVVTHDKQGLPVRALKTNKLGQFVAATPLPNGTYTLTIEKDNLSFDTVEVELNSSVLSPIMISAKKGAVLWLHQLSNWCQFKTSGTM